MKTRSVYKIGEIFIKTVNVVKRYLNEYGRISR